MTLILIAGNKDFVVQVSDRRVTSSLGVVSDEDTKTIYIDTPSQQMLAGYTGLARIGTEPTNRVLLGLLMDRALPRADGDPSRVVHELGSALDVYFRSGPGRVYRARDRRLTISFTGFVSGVVGPHQALLTNFQVWGSHDETEAWPGFTPTFFSPRDEVADEDRTVVQKLGQWQAVGQPEMERVRALLVPGKPARAVRDKMSEMIRDRAATNPTVGLQMNTVILPRGEQPTWGYVTGVNSFSYYSGDTIVQSPDGFVLVASGLQVTAKGPTPMVVPRVQPHAPCPCDSGKRYSDCHGRNSV